MLRTGVKSPARAFLKPASTTRSILKRPSPLPLSPNPLPLSATFSVVPRSGKLSPHVHFPASPAMVATFTAFSPGTYDRGPIIISPTSIDTSSWANRIFSPSVDAFKLSDPPASRRKSEGGLTVPVMEDPRSPKPYVSKATVRFEELSAQVPRGNRGLDALGKAIASYPRSPYPSAPVSPSMEPENDIQEVDDRGRNSGRWPKNSGPKRPKSLETGPKRRLASHLVSPSTQQFLSPVQESPRVTITKPPPLNLTEDDASTRLSHAFWESVSLDPRDMLSPSGVNHEVVTSPTPPIMFGRKDGTLWSPGLPRMKSRDISRSLLSPTPKARLRKSVVASPSPNDPFAAFPSFSIALSGTDITYPPRVLMEQD